MNPVSVKLHVHSVNHEITLGFKEQIIGGDLLPWYDGSYRAIPKTTEQTLETKQKSMRDDVTVEAIPYSEVSNPSGGVTVNIAFV